MDAILERCAGLDVHQETVVACVLAGPLDRKPSQTVETFGTTTRELLRLQDWLASHECIEVAMESTGVLWKPIWNILHEHCRLTLANPQRIKNVPGRKTDVKDAVWIAQLHRCGLVEASFVPDVEIRDLRDLTRYRRKLVQTATQEKNRIHKILQDANMKLTTFVSDIFGVSGRALLDAIVNGEVLEAQEIRQLVKTRLVHKIPELVDALNGRLRAHHRRMIRRHLDHLYFLEEETITLELEIDQAIQPYRAEIELLDTIPGINQAGATAIVAEIGVDMSVFPTEGHIASWAGVCPANHESAKKIKKRKINEEANHSKQPYAKPAGEG